MRSSAESPDRKRLMEIRRTLEVLGRDSDRLLQLVTELLGHEDRRVAYRIEIDPDDPERGDLGRMLRALHSRRLPYQYE